MPAGRDVATAGGIELDKIAALRNQPTAIVEYRSPEGSLRRLAAIFATATDLGPAEELDSPGGQGSPL